MYAFESRRQREASNRPRYSEIEVKMMAYRAGFYILILTIAISRLMEML